MLCVPQASTFLYLILFVGCDILPCGASGLIADINSDSSVGSWLAECWGAFGKPHWMRIRQNRF